MLTLKRIDEQIALREKELREFIDNANKQVAAWNGAIQQLNELKRLLTEAEDEQKQEEQTQDSQSMVKDLMPDN